MTDTYAVLKQAVTLPGGVYAVGAKPKRKRVLPVGTKIRVLAVSPTAVKAYGDSALCTTRLKTDAVWGSTFTIAVSQLEMV